MKVASFFCPAGLSCPSQGLRKHVLKSGSTAPSSKFFSEVTQSKCMAGKELGRRGRHQLVCSCSRLYGPQNALDTTLAWGDILTLTATEVSSDRVPVSQVGMLCSVLVLAWVGTATAKGDYRYKAASNQMLFGQHQINMCLAAFNSSTTWIMFVPVALACYASLVSHDLMPKTTFAASAHSGELPAQLEVLFAALFTVSSWRGIYAGLRPYI